MRNLANREEQKTIGVVSDQIGTPTYAGDLAQTILQILNGGHIEAGIYHYTNEGTASWYDFTKVIMRNLESEAYDYVSPLHTSEYPTPAKRPHYSVLDKTKIKNVYGVKISYWEDSLRECLDKLRLIEEKEKSN
jgi:dTDP-4-dehydrorhamnose reductase